MRGFNGGGTASKDATHLPRFGVSVTLQAVSPRVIDLGRKVNGQNPTGPVGLCLCGVLPDGVWSEWGFALDSGEKCPYPSTTVRGSCVIW